RSPATWTEESLDAATRGAERLRTAVEHVETVLHGNGPRGGAGAAPGRPAAPRGGEAAESPGDPAGLIPAAAAAREVFTAAVDAAHPLLARLRGGGPADEISGDELVALIAEGRMRARRQKDWATSDAIRSRLQAVGVLLEDAPTGWTWRLR